jgi:hypothetical protein
LCPKCPKTKTPQFAQQDAPRSKSKQKIAETSAAEKEGGNRDKGKADDCNEGEIFEEKNADKNEEKAGDKHEEKSVDNNEEEMAGDITGKNAVDLNEKIVGDIVYNAGGNDEVEKVSEIHEEMAVDINEENVDDITEDKADENDGKVSDPASTLIIAGKVGLDDPEEEKCDSTSGPESADIPCNVCKQTEPNIADEDCDLCEKKCHFYCRLFD